MNKQILIIDDDLVVRNSLKKVLQDLGHRVALAADGQEGLACLKQETFDLLLLDLDLPKISGWDLLDHVQKQGARLPVVVLTAFLDQCEPGALAQADAWLEKPPDVSRLLQTLDQLLHEPAEVRCLRLVGSTNPLVSPERSYLHLPELSLRSLGQSLPGDSF